MQIIVSSDKDGFIGKDNQLLWHKCPMDMRWFSTLTFGHRIVMGRKTFESIGRCLPYRQTIIITSQPELYCDPDNGITAMTWRQYVHLPLETRYYDFMIGGGELYKLALSETDKILHNVLDISLPGDTTFPLDLAPFGFEQVLEYPTEGDIYVTPTDKRKITMDTRVWVRRSLWL